MINPGLAVRVASGRAPRPPVARGAAVSLETTAGRGGRGAVLDAKSGRHGPRGRLRAGPTGATGAQASTRA